MINKEQKEIIATNFETIDGKTYEPFSDKEYVYLPMAMKDSPMFYYKINKKLFVIGEEYDKNN